MNLHQLRKTRTEMQRLGMAYSARNEQGKKVIALTAKGAAFGFSSILNSIMQRAANEGRDFTPEEIAEILANLATLETILKGDMR